MFRPRPLLELIMKTLCVKMIFVAVTFVGVASAAHAAVVCTPVWVQTGPFYGQGFYDTVCTYY
jgi:opacity protein-like surface antigen